MKVRGEARKYHLRTDLLTDGLTWVGARDTGVSKNYGIFVFKIVFRQFSFELRIGAW